MLRLHIGCELLTNLVSLDSRNNNVPIKHTAETVVNCLQILYLWIVETTLIYCIGNVEWL